MEGKNESDSQNGQGTEDGILQHRIGRTVPMVEIRSRIQQAGNTRGRDEYGNQSREFETQRAIHLCGHRRIRR